MKSENGMGAGIAKDWDMDGDGEGAFAEGEGASEAGDGEGEIERAEFDSDGGLEEGDGALDAELVGGGDWAATAEEGDGDGTTEEEVSGEGEIDCARALAQRNARKSKLVTEFMVMGRRIVMPMEGGADERMGCEGWLVD